MFNLIFLVLFVLFLVLFFATALAHIFFLVPYVPTRNDVAGKMIEMAGIKAGENVFDLGCGDGRLLFLAENKAKIRCVGYEVAPLIYLFALVRKLIARSKVKIKFKSFFRADLRKADVIFCYLFPGVMTKLEKKIRKECKKGTRIISNTFHMPGMKPVRVIEKNPAKGLPTIYLYRL
jgi:predicted RNA methylase